MKRLQKEENCEKELMGGCNKAKMKREEPEVKPARHKKAKMTRVR